MKCYIISKDAAGKVTLLAQALIRGQLQEQTFAGPFDTGNSSLSTKALAFTILCHYFGATPGDPAAQAEAQRQTVPFMDAFLLTHNMLPNSRYEISSDVIDRFFSL